MIVHTLGPAGTFSHEATQKIFPQSDVVFAPNFDALFALLMKNPQEIGVVPIENSLHGSIDEILDLLYGSDVRIVQMHDVAIEHAFGAQNKETTIKTVASHSQALRQCHAWLTKQYPDALHIPTASTALAAELAKNDPTIAAIAAKSTLEAYGLTVLAEHIEGDGNMTRFAVVSVRDPFPEKTRTHMMAVLRPTEDRAGLLHALLTPFKIYDINLTRIESRPIGTKIGQYVFFVDFIGNPEEMRTKQLLTEISSLAEVTILGQW